MSYSSSWIRVLAKFLLFAQAQALLPPLHTTANLLDGNEAGRGRRLFLGGAFAPAAALFSPPPARASLPPCPSRPPPADKNCRSCSGGGNLGKLPKWQAPGGINDAAAWTDILEVRMSGKSLAFDNVPSGLSN